MGNGEDGIWVQMGIKYGLPNYSNVEVHAGISKKTPNILDDEEWGTLWAKLNEQIEGALESALNDMKQS